MSRYEPNFRPLSSICFEQYGCSDWQQDIESLATARILTNEAANGKRRPFQIVIATDRICPLGDIIDSIILSTEGTGLLKAQCDGQPIVRLHLQTRGESSVDILRVNNEHIQRLQNSGVKFTYEVCNSSSGISELTNARECAMQFIRKLPKDDNPIILWLDDDLAFDALITQNSEVGLSRPWSFFHEVWRFHEMYPEIDIGLGDVTGVPPLPASSTLNTNLLDLNANISGIAARSDKERWTESDYYYDLSDLSRNNQPWTMDSSRIGTNKTLWKILEEGTLARPLVATSSNFLIQENRYIRGGNTIIFNHGLLHETDHPKIPRRGDTIWSLMVQKRGGRLGHFPLPLRHIRDNFDDNWTPDSALNNWIRRLKVDLIGASFQRYYANNNSIRAEDILIERCERQLEAFRNSLNLVNNLQDELRIPLTKFIEKGIDVTSQLKRNPDVFETYHLAVKSQLVILHDAIQHEEVEA